MSEEKDLKTKEKIKELEVEIYILHLYCRDREEKLNAEITRLKLQLGECYDTAKTN